MEKPPVIRIPLNPYHTKEDLYLLILLNMLNQLTGKHWEVAFFDDRAGRIRWVNYFADDELVGWHIPYRKHLDWLIEELRNYISPSGTEVRLTFYTVRHDEEGQKEKEVTK